MAEAVRFKWGISPINWANEDLPEWGDGYTGEAILRDMARLGVQGTEFSRKFPRDAPQLKALLARYGLALASQWKGVRLIDPRRRAEELAALAAHVDFLATMGCRHVIICEVTRSFQDAAYRQAPRAARRLSDAEWVHLIDGLHEAGRLCCARGMRLVYHHHADTVVETPEAIGRLLEHTDPERVSLLLDTGHAVYGGGDPLDLLRRYGDRIAYVHFKDVRLDVLECVRADGLSFLEAVRRGVFTVPGDGGLDFGPLVAELLARGYDGWVIVEAEQNPERADPFTYAEKAMAYLRTLLVRAQRPAQGEGERAESRGDTRGDHAHGEGKALT